MHIYKTSLTVVRCFCSLQIYGYSELNSTRYPWYTVLIWHWRERQWLSIIFHLYCFFWHHTSLIGSSLCVFLWIKMENSVPWFSCFFMHFFCLPVFGLFKKKVMGINQYSAFVFEEEPQDHPSLWQDGRYTWINQVFAPIANWPESNRFLSHVENRV